MRSVLEVLKEESSNESGPAETKEILIQTVPAEDRNPLTMPSIRHNSDEEIFQVILMSLAKSYTDLGWEQPKQKDKDYLANELADTIPRRFPSIRLHEIPKAFANGIRGKYGKFFGLNVVSFENFIEAHLTCESREQLAKLIPAMPEKTKKPDLNTRFSIAKGNAIKAFDHLSCGKDIQLSALVVYNFLDEIGVISFDNQDKWGFIKDAVEYLEKDLLKKSRETTNEIRRIDIQRQLVAVKNGEAVELIRNMGRRFALYSFFNSCIKKNTILEELIDNKKGNYS